MSQWARYRKDPVTFHPEDIDTSLCTHFIYAFAVLDSSGVHIVPSEPSDLEMWAHTIWFKYVKALMPIQACNRLRKLNRKYLGVYELGL